MPVTLVDTAGLRPSADPVESIGVARAREEGERADVWLYVFDVAEGFSEDDAEAFACAPSSAVRLLVANKSDRLTGTAEQMPDGALLTCGLDPATGELLRRRLTEIVADGVQSEVSSELLGTLRQAELVRRARAGATAALEALASGTPPEYAATHCDAALSALSDLVGETTSEDVLQRLFATFCIGK